MSKFTQLIASIKNVIKQNNTQDITGISLQNVLVSMVNSIGAYATFAGIASPSTNPGTIDGNVFFIAYQDGTYSNFGNITLKNEVAIIQNTTGTWTKVTTGIATSVMLQDAVTKKPGIVTEHGEVFNHDTNTVGENGVNNHAEGQGTTCDGSCCHAEGVDTYASSYASHAEGQKTVTAGSASHSEGIECVANGDASHAEGYKTTANGIYSHAEGANTQAGAQGHAEGNGSIAGDTGHAEGKNTISNGNFSHSEGDGTEATGDSSHSEGYRTKATGRQAHSEGNSTVASGLYSHAEGKSTVASGDFTHTEGYLTTAKGKYSHSEGHSCSALGLSSHAEGDSNTASGDYSHAEGLYTEVAKFCGHVEGKYNKVTDSIHILGGGDSDTDRKNLHEIKDDGSQYMIGIGGYNGKNRDTAKDLATVLNEGLPTNLIFVNRNFPTNNEQLTEDDKSLLYRLSSGTTTGIFFHNADIVFPVSVNVSKYGGGGSIQYTIAISYIFDGYEETATASLTKRGLDTSYSENWSVVKKEFTGGSSGSGVNVVQKTGYSEEDVMSQKAVTEAIHLATINSFSELKEKFIEWQKKESLTPECYHVIFREENTSLNNPPKIVRNGVVFFQKTTYSSYSSDFATFIGYRQDDSNDYGDIIFCCEYIRIQDGNIKWENAIKANNIPEFIAQTTGDSTTAVMSQKAVTDAINKIQLQQGMATKFIDLTTLASASSNEEVTAILGTVSEFRAEKNNTLYYVKSFNNYTILPLSIRYTDGKLYIYVQILEGGYIIMVELDIVITDDKWGTVQFNQYLLQLNKSE